MLVEKFGRGEGGVRVGGGLGNIVSFLRPLWRQLEARFGILEERTTQSCPKIIGMGAIRTHVVNFPHVVLDGTGFWLAVRWRSSPTVKATSPMQSFGPLPVQWGSAPRLCPNRTAATGFLTMQRCSRSLSWCRAVQTWSSASTAWCLQLWGEGPKNGARELQLSGVSAWHVAERRRVPAAVQPFSCTFELAQPLQWGQGVKLLLECRLQCGK